MNGNGKSPQVSISRLIHVRWHAGDPYLAISQLLETKPTGTLLLHISQGTVNGLEWTEKNNSKNSLDKAFSL